MAAGAALGLALVLPLTTSAQASLPSAAGGGAGSLEVNVTQASTLSNGQPIVAVNPKNPNNVVYISTDHTPATTTVRTQYHCYAAYSTNGGATWTRVAFPYGNRAECGDPYLAVDSQGTFYTAFNRLGCAPGAPTESSPGGCGGAPNHVGVARSTDGGRTWSTPVDTPLLIATTPRLRVDAATDKVYAVGTLTPAPSPHAVTISSDRGRTWTTPTTTLPDQAFGNQIAVGHGILMTGTCLKVVNNTSIEPTTVTIAVSRDGGKTFTSSLLTDSKGATVAPPSGSTVPSQALLASDPIPWVSADPTKAGRFAVMIPRGDTFEVYVTENAGTKWTGPTVISAPGAFRPWIDFGARGALGVMWRTQPDVDVFSTVSFDHGKTFSPTVKVNKTTQPYFKGEGDEFSRILVTDKYAYVTWADARSGGQLDGIVGRVPLALYKH
ncbi:sialidase family protein [Cryptosporangium sp. NPDC048952]|uniref:sialidase family protein n=1 Tax=Cryptosporangium sp. NPDC048952 TaxID=3363961 RepID=UPI003719C6BB